MSRIDVVLAEKGKFKVLHNFIQHGIPYATKAQADKEAEALKKVYPQAKITN